MTAIRYNRFKNKCIRKTYDEICALYYLSPDSNEKQAIQYAFWQEYGIISERKKEPCMSSQERSFWETILLAIAETIYCSFETFQSAVELFVSLAYEATKTTRLEGLKYGTFPN